MKFRRSDLGGALGGAIEPRPTEEEINLFPGFSTGFFDMEEALDLWTGPRPEKVL